MKRIIGSTIIILAAAACSPQKNKPVEMITQPDQTLVERQEKMQKNLEAQNFQYLESRREFRGEAKGQLPCDPKLRELMQNSSKEAADIEKQVLRRDQSKFREKALDFSRKINAQRESLELIAAAIENYCTQDAAKIAACLGQAEPVKVVINEQIGGYVPVQPFVRLKAGERFAFFGFKDENRIRGKLWENLVDTRSAGITDLIPLTSRTQLRELLTCMSGVEPKSETGKSVLITVQNALADADRECTERFNSWRARVGEGGELIQTDERFCGPLEIQN